MSILSIFPIQSLTESFQFYLLYFKFLSFNLLIHHSKPPLLSKLLTLLAWTPLPCKLVSWVFGPPPPTSSLLSIPPPGVFFQNRYLIMSLTHSEHLSGSPLLLGERSKLCLRLCRVCILLLSPVLPSIRFRVVFYFISFPQICHICSHHLTMAYSVQSVRLPLIIPHISHGPFLNLLD